MFKNKRLANIIICNVKIAIYLDVTLNLNDGSYRHYIKANDQPHLY